jgi:hypothetical protein
MCRCPATIKICQHKTLYPCNAIVNAASDITYRPVIEADVLNTWTLTFCLKTRFTYFWAFVSRTTAGTLLMFRKANKTTINKNKTTNFYRSTSFRFSFILRYFKVFQVKRIVYGFLFPAISNTVHFFCFNSTVSYTCTQFTIG